MADSDCDLDTLTAMLNEDNDEQEEKKTQGKTDADDFNELDLDDLTSMLEEDDDFFDGDKAEKEKLEEGKSITSADLGLDMSDDDDSTNATTSVSAHHKVKKKSSFAEAFTNVQTNVQNKKPEPIDPLEQELRAMEERMNKIKSELAKKKNIDTTTTNQKFTKLTNPVNNVKETTKVLSGSEKLEMLKRLKDNKSSLVHGGDTDSEDDEDNRNPFETRYNSYGREMKKKLENPSPSVNNINSASKSLEMKSSQPVSQSVAGWKKVSGSMVAPQLNASGLTKSAKEMNAIRESNSGIYIMNLTLTESQLSSRMEGRRYLSLTSLPLHIKGGEIEGDWFTIGVLVAKSQPKTSQKGTQYSIWSLSDLKDCTKTVGVFLFGNAHQDLWKNVVGSVVGVLNPQMMKDRQGDHNTNLITLSVNNGLKVMVLGVSRDLSWCKGRTKAGNQCVQFVNKSVCEFCIYHIQREYQKSTSKRSEIQSSFSRIGGSKQTSLQQKVLGKEQVFYGGNLFSGNSSQHQNSLNNHTGPLIPSKANNKLRAKDLATLSSLHLKEKSNALMLTEREAVMEGNTPKLGVGSSSKIGVGNGSRNEDKGTMASRLKHLSEQELEAAKKLAKESDGLGKMLLAPTPGARNLLRYKAKEGETVENDAKISRGESVSVSAKELLKMTHARVLQQKREQSERLKTPNKATSFSKAFGSGSPSTNSGPQLGRGLQPGQSIDLDFSPSIAKQSFDPAKAKALAILKRKGEKLKPQEKNFVRSKDKIQTPEFQENVRKRLRETDNASENSPKRKKEDEYSTSKSLLGSVDLNAEKIKEMLERKSKHGSLLDAEEEIAMEKYYLKLEKKEMLEDQITSVKELSIKAVICSICKYQAVMQSQFCKDQGHSVKVVQATKRFFECTGCKRRTVSLEKMPSKSCRNCDRRSWKRVAMGKAKTGPKMENEVLCLRGNEQQHYSGGAEKAFLNIDG